MTTDADTAGRNNLPRHAIVKNIGRCDVLGYYKAGYFWLLDKNDERRLIHRERITFLRDASARPSADANDVS